MRTCIIFQLVFFALSTLTMSAQRDGDADDAVLDVLVWGTHVPIDPQGYSSVLRADVEAYLRRAAEYRSARPAPSSGVFELVHAAQVGYERRLVAISADREAAGLAAAYVDRLRPCYEWEGFHDCPEREALFADEYQAARPNGPFSSYLPLLAAHRWLCTAEAYEYEKKPEEASRSRRLYEERLAVALRSRTLLIRTAAERLLARGQCFPAR